MKKSLLLIASILLISFVFAVTLTKEATDHVEIKNAVLGELCKRNDCGVLVVGIGKVYGKTADAEDFIIFSFKNNIYRSTTAYPSYNNETNEINSWKGECSVLDSNAQYGERQIDCNYELKLSGNLIEDFSLNFEHKDKKLKTKDNSFSVSNENIENYELVSIDDSLSNIIWIPGDSNLK